ncbi:MAG: PBSX family phage terminase large subunit [Marinilabiliaceae bacterium]|nr:PBSX family phage terminase large subunit [Marinilabiliaceae bacterium]
MTVKYLQTTKIFAQIQKAKEMGYTVCSEQGSSRSSKTYNTVIWLIYYAWYHPNKIVSVCRATLPALKSSVLRDFLSITAKMGVFDAKAFNKSELIYKVPNGTEIEFFSCDSEQKLRGRKRHILYCNEANELGYMQWQQLQLRTTEFTIIDYNPSFTDDHWICDVNKDTRTYHFITTYKDNPFLEQKIVDEIESLQHKNQSLWQIYGLGIQAQIEGLIFKDIEQCADIPPLVRHRAYGVDYGFTHDPTAIIEVAWNGDDVWLKEHCYQTEMLTGDIIRQFKAIPRLEIISESADPRMIKELSLSGLNIHEVKKSGHKIESINKMLEYKIHVTRDSINLLREFRNYTYAQNREGKFLNEPIDGYDHGIDAARYVFMMRIMGKVEQKRSASSYF